MQEGKKFWDRAAAYYTALQEKSGKQYEVLAARCRPYLKKDFRVLELACGTGQLTFPLAGEVASWEATDYSRRMIEAAEKRGDTPARFSVADATALPYEAEQFDAVLMANALHIMPHPEKALAEIRRVLAPNGVFLVPTFLYEGTYNRLRMWLLQKLGFRTFHKWTLATLQAYLEEAGFTVAEAALLKGKPLPQGFFAATKKKEPQE